MSTRKGEIVLLHDFLTHANKEAKKAINKRKTKGDSKKVAIAAVKYAMLRNEINKNITFDIKESLRFEGDTGPYLLYSYARATSIIKKAKSKNKGKPKIDKFENSELSLMKQILRFPELVENSGKLMNPSLIANYSYELAKIFNEFYHNCKVLGSKEEHFRLRLIDSFRTTLKNSLYLLGIETMEEM